jgi:AhpD family alkylhydroperoxidase
MATKHPFPLHDENTAPPAAAEALAATRKNFGMIPNLERVMASAPPLLEAYSRTWDLFDTTTLSEIERQVVYLTANFENDCAYCVPWHTLLATKAGMAPEAIEALRNGSRIPDEKLEALRSFTRTLIANREADEQLHQLPRGNPARPPAASLPLEKADDRAARRVTSHDWFKRSARVPSSHLRPHSFIAWRTGFRAFPFSVSS